MLRLFNRNQAPASLHAKPTAPLHSSSLVLLLFAGALLAACGAKDSEPTPTKRGYSNNELKLSGDKTIYGLACEGCNDSTIVLLPNTGGDPVHYDIIDAFRNKKVLGKPRIGDWLGLVVNEEDSTMADLVVNLDELKGTWCYVVMPKMRDFDNMPPRLQRRMMQDMPDSVKQTLMVPREYGFTLKRQWTAQSVGYIRQRNALQDESPVVYPPLSYFTEWHIWNGRLVMTSGKPTFSTEDAQMTMTDVRYDTCDIVYLRDDSLVLSSEGATRGYYRKRNAAEANKQAKALAAEEAKKALQQ